VKSDEHIHHQLFFLLSSCSLHHLHHAFYSCYQLSYQACPGYHPNISSIWMYYCRIWWNILNCQPFSICPFPSAYSHIDSSLTRSTPYRPLLLLLNVYSFTPGPTVSKSLSQHDLHLSPSTDTRKTPHLTMTTLSTLSIAPVS